MMQETKRLYWKPGSMERSPNVYPYHKEEVYTADTGAGVTKKTWTIDIPWASIPIKRL